MTCIRKGEAIRVCVAHAVSGNDDDLQKQRKLISDMLAVGVARPVVPGAVIHHIDSAVATHEVLVLAVTVVALQKPPYAILHHHGDGEPLHEHDDVTVFADLVDGVAHEGDEEVDEEERGGEDEDDVERVDEGGTREAEGREVDHVQDDGDGRVEGARLTAELWDTSLGAVVVEHHVEDVGEGRQDDDEDEEEVHHVAEHRLDGDGEVADGRQELDEVEERPRQHETGANLTELTHQRDPGGREEPGRRPEHGHRDEQQLADAVEVVVQRRLATTDDTLCTPAPPAAVVQEEVGALVDVEEKYEDGQSEHVHGRRHAGPVRQVKDRFAAVNALGALVIGGKLRILEQQERADVRDTDDEPDEEKRPTDEHLGVDPLAGGRPREQGLALVAVQSRLLQGEQELDGRVVPATAGQEALVLRHVVPLVRQRPVGLHLRQVDPGRLHDGVVQP